MPLAKVRDEARIVYVSWQKKLRGITDPAGWVRELDHQLEMYDHIDRIVPLDDVSIAAQTKADARECTEATDFVMVWTADYCVTQQRKLSEGSSELLWAIHTLEGGEKVRFMVWGAPLEDIRNLKHVRVGQVSLAKVERLKWFRDSVFPFERAPQHEITGAISEALQKFFEHQFV